MSFKSFTCWIVVMWCALGVKAQETTYNQYDAEGKRHGKWKGVYEDTKTIRYQGEFNHGKEIGVFKYYDKNYPKRLIATREFNSQDDSCFIVFYDNKSKVSEGMIVNKQYEGEWRYFHKNSPSLMTLENYKAGKLEGVRKVFYANEVLAEAVEYKNGLKHGTSFIYNQKGILIEKATYANGELHGPIVIYENDGTISIEGQYTNDKATGVWSYYKNAKKEKEVVKGKPRNKKKP